MPFVVTNMPATFIDLRNRVFKEHLNKFVIVFIDNIFIYSKNQEKYGEHLRITLQILKEQQLYAQILKMWILAR